MRSSASSRCLMRRIQIRVRRSDTFAGSLNSRSQSLLCRLIPSAAATTLTFGLRERIAARALSSYRSQYEASSGKITGLDYTLLIDAGVTGDEMRAILESISICFFPAIAPRSFSSPTPTSMRLEAGR